MKVALVHDFLIHNRGGERVFAEIAKLYPSADIFTLLYDERLFKEVFRERTVFCSPVQKFPFSNKYNRLYFLFYPLAIRTFDLRGYDLVISSSSMWAHAVLTMPETCHICYYHTPFRYLWHYHEEFLRRQPLPLRWPARCILSHMRRWDLSASQRVDYAIANSQEVRNRIFKYYNKDSEIIHPPVRVEDFKVSREIGNFFLVVSALVAHKRVDIAVKAFTDLRLPLIVVGEGSERHRLQKMAGPNVRFVGALSDDKVRELYSRCRAFLFPSADDFGMTPIEAQASGRPVIAYAAGGALETVEEGLTGVFFHQQTPEALVWAVDRFFSLKFDPYVIRERAGRFDIKNFQERFSSFVQSKMIQFVSRFPRHGSSFLLQGQAEDR